VHQRPPNAPGRDPANNERWKMLLAEAFEEKKAHTLDVKGLANFFSGKLALQAMSLRAPCGSLPCKR